MTSPRIVKFRAFCTLAVFALACTPSLWAQGLPLRNLQLEVRQVQSSNAEQSGAQGSVRVQGSSSGAVGVEGGLQWDSRQTQHAGRALQTSLVLNGRSTWVELGQLQPLRLLQTLVRNGQTYLATSTVLVASRTGFAATPRWTGGDTVELELSAQQRLGQAAAPALPAHSATGSVLMLVLDTWSTVAQSEEEAEGSGTAALGQRSNSLRQRTEVQVRVSLR